MLAQSGRDRRHRRPDVRRALKASCSWARFTGGRALCADGARGERGAYLRRYVPTIALVMAASDCRVSSFSRSRDGVAREGARGHSTGWSSSRCRSGSRISPAGWCSTSRSSRLRRPSSRRSAASDGMPPRRSVCSPAVVMPVVPLVAPRGSSSFVSAAIDVERARTSTSDTSSMSFLSCSSGWRSGSENGSREKPPSASVSSSVACAAVRGCRRRSSGWSTMPGSSPSPCSRGCRLSDSTAALVIGLGGFVAAAGVLHAHARPRDVALDLAGGRAHG